MNLGTSGNYKRWLMESLPPLSTIPSLEMAWGSLYWTYSFPYEYPIVLPEPDRDLAEPDTYQLQHPQNTQNQYRPKHSQAKVADTIPFNWESTGDDKNIRREIAPRIITTKMVRFCRSRRWMESLPRATGAFDSPRALLFFHLRHPSREQIHAPLRLFRLGRR